MKSKRARFLIPLLIVCGGSGIAYLTLLSRGSTLLESRGTSRASRTAQITLGPYPRGGVLARFKSNGGRYVVSLLDRRQPYESMLLTQETIQARRVGLMIRSFPMSALQDQDVSSNSFEQAREAVQFLEQIDRPAYVHAYLNGRRLASVRDGLLKAGIPATFSDPAGISKEDYEIAARLTKARALFGKGEFAKTLEILQSVKGNDMDVFYLRGWSHYRLGLVTDAARDFKQGLAIDPEGPRDLDGLGYCDLQQGNPVMAQKRFDQVLDEVPGQEEALIGQGLAYLALQNKLAAAQVFRKVLEMDHSNTEVTKYLRRAE